MNALGIFEARGSMLEQRISILDQPVAKAELLYRLGTLQMREFGDKVLDSGTLRQALESSPEHARSRAAIESLLDDDELISEVFDALEIAYDTLGSSADLASLYQRRVDRAKSTDERTRARLDYAGVLETRVGDAVRAQSALATAVLEDPASDESLAELERVAGITGEWRLAVDALSKALDVESALTVAGRTERWMRLADWRREHLSDVRGAEDAYARARTIDPDNLDVLRSLESIRRVPGRESDLLDVIRARARLEIDFETRRELLREGVGLAQAALGDVALAESVLRELIAQDEADPWALAELTEIRRQAGDAKEVVELLLRRSELADDGAQISSLKHQAARVMLDELRDAPRATSLYRELLDADPYDVEAASVLRKLYDDGGQYKDLAKLLDLLIDVAPTPDRRSSLRLELARLYHDRFRAPDDAIEVLRSILQEEPTQSEAVLELSRLYEETGRDGELADLIKEQIDEARERGEVQVELALLVRLGELEELRLGDGTAAARTYEQVLERDPKHRGALEAVARMSAHRDDWRRAAERRLGFLSKERPTRLASIGPFDSLTLERGRTTLRAQRMRFAAHCRWTPRTRAFGRNSECDGREPKDGRICLTFLSETPMRLQTLLHPRRTDRLRPRSQRAPRHPLERAFLRARASRPPAFRSLCRGTSPSR